jgi:hypothetical protein
MQRLETGGKVMQRLETQTGGKVMQRLETGGGNRAEAGNWGQSH